MAPPADHPDFDHDKHDERMELLGDLRAVHELLVMLGPWAQPGADPALKLCHDQIAAHQMRLAQHIGSGDW